MCGVQNIDGHSNGTSSSQTVFKKLYWIVTRVIHSFNYTPTMTRLGGLRRYKIMLEGWTLESFNVPVERLFLSIDVWFGNCGRGIPAKLFIFPGKLGPGWDLLFGTLFCRFIIEGIVSGLLLIGTPLFWCGFDAWAASGKFGDAWFWDMLSSVEQE